MIRRYCQNSIKYSFLSIPSLFGQDRLDKVTSTEQNADMTIVQEETGWDRLKQMFEVDELGNITREVNSIVQVASCSVFIGIIYGGYMDGKNAYMEFMRNNEATAFKDHMEAKRKLQEKVTLGFSKGAFKWGWRLTLFCTSFVGISTLIQVYRGTYGIREYAAAGGITGAMYKFNMGPRGWIVGGGLGAVVWTIWYWLQWNSCLKLGRYILDVYVCLNTTDDNRSTIWIRTVVTLHCLVLQVLKIILHIFTHAQYADMVFVYGFCNENALAACIDYHRRIPNHRVSGSRVFTTLLIKLLENGAVIGSYISSEPANEQNVDELEGIIPLTELQQVQ